MSTLRSAQRQYRELKRLGDCYAALRDHRRARRYYNEAVCAAPVRSVPSIGPGVLSMQAQRLARRKDEVPHPPLPLPSCRQGDQEVHEAAGRQPVAFPLRQVVVFPDTGQQPQRPAAAAHQPQQLGVPAQPQPGPAVLPRQNDNSYPAAGRLHQAPGRPAGLVLGMHHPEGGRKDGLQAAATGPVQRQQVIVLVGVLLAGLEPERPLAGFQLEHLQLDQLVGGPGRHPAEQGQAGVPTAPGRQSDTGGAALGHHHLRPGIGGDVQLALGQHRQAGPAHFVVGRRVTKLLGRDRPRQQSQQHHQHPRQSLHDSPRKTWSARSSFCSYMASIRSR